MNRLKHKAQPLANQNLALAQSSRHGLLQIKPFRKFENGFRIVKVTIQDALDYLLHRHGASFVSVYRPRHEERV
jgi:hypothetical protein